MELVGNLYWLTVYWIGFKGEILNCIENKISVTELLNIFSRDDRESVVRSDPHHGIQLFPFTCAGIELQNMVKEAIDIVISS